MGRVAEAVLENLYTLNQKLVAEFRPHPRFQDAMMAVRALSEKVEQAKARARLA
jgi:hypothetical protein